MLGPKAARTFARWLATVEEGGRTRRSYIWRAPAALPALLEGGRTGGRASGRRRRLVVAAGGRRRRGRQKSESGFPKGSFEPPWLAGWLLGFVRTNRAGQLQKDTNGLVTCHARI